MTKPGGRAPMFPETKPGTGNDQYPVPNVQFKEKREDFRRDNRMGKKRNWKNIQMEMEA